MPPIIYAVFVALAQHTPCITHLKVLYRNMPITFSLCQRENNSQRFANLCLRRETNQKMHYLLYIMCIMCIMFVYPPNL